MKKLISLLLVLLMVISLLPMAALANDDGTTPPPTEPAGEEKPAPQKKHIHKYNLVQYNMKYHWKECECGLKISMEPHVDPKDTLDDTCTCGFHFSDNADLVTLWVKGCQPIKDFNKNVTDYTLKTVTYKAVKEVKISTRTFDAQSTVELPEDLTLKKGTNVIPVKVIAGNKKTTKTYTLTIINESE